MLQLALIASSLLGDLPRDAMRLIAVVVTTILVALLLAVIVTAVMAATLLGAAPGIGGPEQPPAPPAHLTRMVEVRGGHGVPLARTNGDRRLVTVPAPGAPPASMPVAPAAVEAAS